MEDNKEKQPEELKGQGTEGPKEEVKTDEKKSVVSDAQADKPGAPTEKKEGEKNQAAKTHGGFDRFRRGTAGGRGPGGFRGGGGRGPGGPGGRRGRRDKPEFAVQSEYDEKNLEIARVTRVTKGGKRMRFRALAVIGNRKGRVGYGVGKGVDYPGSTSKAAAQARKSLITVPIREETIPHAVRASFGAAQVILKPAPKGTGIKAGGPVRVVLELAGVGNVTAKILGSKGKINNVKATFKALGMLRVPQKNASSAKGNEKKNEMKPETNAKEATA